MPTLRTDAPRPTPRPDPGRTLRTAADARPPLALAPTPVVPFEPTPYTPVVTDPGDTVVPDLPAIPELPDDSGATAVGDILPEDATFEDLNQSALDSALAAIEAQFGLTREQLLADQSAVGQEYQLLFAQAQRARERGVEQTEQAGVERGIARSGIQAENVANTITEFDAQLAQLEQQRSTRQESIASQIAGLDLQEQIARQEAERTAALRTLDQEVLAALADAGL